MKFKGTLIAVIVIVLLAVLAKFSFKSDFTPKDVVVEPTEDVTLEFVPNTAFGVLPTEN